MFVPMWIVWLAVALLAVPVLFVVVPLALMGLFAAYVKALELVCPPAPGSILDPMGERMARGTPRHKWYKTPYLTEEERQRFSGGR